MPPSYIVSTDHVDYLISASLEVFIGSTYGPSSWQDPNFIGRELLRQNYACVLHENGGQRKQSSQLAFAPGPDVYQFRPFDEVDAVQVFKALDCYEYQASNHPGWENSDAQRFCSMLRRFFTRKLPGYDDAMWDVERNEPDAGSTRPVGVESIRADLAAARDMLTSMNGSDIDKYIKAAGYFIDSALKALCPHDLKDFEKSVDDSGQQIVMCTRCNVSWPKP